MKTKHATRVSTRTDKPAPAAEQPKLEPRELTPHQRHLADIAGHLIMTGGFNDDVLNVFLYNLIKEEHARAFGELPDADNRTTANYLSNKLVEWKRATLRDAIAPHDLTEPERTASMPPTAYIRAGVRWQLWHRLQAFLNGGTPEEIAFMDGVMMHWGGIPRHLRPRAGWRRALHDAELPGLERHFFVVPARHAEAAEAYLKMLLDAERQAQARK